jgi:hypothetical protein
VAPWHPYRVRGNATLEGRVKTLPLLQGRGSLCHDSHSLKLNGLAEIVAPVAARGKAVAHLVPRPQNKAWPWPPWHRASSNFLGLFFPLIGKDILVAIRGY